MADVHTREIRSKNMRAIRTRDTAIEQRVALQLAELGFDFRVQDKSLPGRPDFVLSEQQAIIFVHGCFWHRHHCYLFRLPATRTAFWSAKIDGNVERDKRDIHALQQAGWKVLVIWECALRNKLRLNDAALADRLEEWLLRMEQSAEIDHLGIHHYGET